MSARRSRSKAKSKAARDEPAPSTKQGFTGGEAAKLSGVKYATLDYWDRTGFLKPTLSTQSGLSGKGRDRIYSFTDLVALRVARELREQGIPLQRIRKVVDHLLAAGSNRPLSTNRLYVVGDDVIVRGGEQPTRERAQSPRSGRVASRRRDGARTRRERNARPRRTSLSNARSPPAGAGIHGLARQRLLGRER